MKSAEHSVSHMLELHWPFGSGGQSEDIEAAPHYCIPRDCELHCRVCGGCSELIPDESDCGGQAAHDCAVVR